MSSTPLRRYSRAFWLGLIPAFVIGVVYLSASAYFSNGHLDSPIDDAFIFFQFAKNTALGYVMTYQIGEGPTGGCTSLLWMLYLAGGWLVGFRGVLLAWFAGASQLALFVLAAALLQRLLGHVGLSERRAAGGATLFAISGPVAYAFFSSTEAALFATLTLAAAYFWIRAATGRFVAAAALLCWARPEGAIITAALGGAYLFTAVTPPRRKWLLVVIPAAAAAWAAFMYAATGDVRTNSYYAKSPLAAYAGDSRPSDYYREFYLVRPRIALVNEIKSGLGYVQRFDLLPGATPHHAVDAVVSLEGAFSRWGVRPLLLAAALIGFVWALVKRRRFAVAAGVAFSALLVTNAFTLGDEHFFYQRSRYAVPLIILALAFAVSGVGTLLGRRKPWGIIVFIIATAVTVPTTAVWAASYAGDVAFVHRYYSPITEYINTRLDKGVVIASHDAGYFSYYSHARIVDIYGLGARRYAEAVRHRDGALFEELEKESPEPAYILLYDATNPCLEATVVGKPVKGFFAKALGVYCSSSLSHTNFTGCRADAPRGGPLTKVVDAVDVADVASEREHKYRYGCDRGFTLQWRFERENGFSANMTEITRSGVPYALRSRYAGGREVADAGRVIAEWEEFRAKTTPGKDAWLILRTDRGLAPVNVYVNDRAVGSWHGAPGPKPDAWVEPRFLIPARFLRGNDLIRLVPAVEAKTFNHTSFHFWLVQ